MKFGPVEGTAEEIKGFIQDNGLQVELYFQANESPIRNRWLVLAAAIVVIAMATLAVAGVSQPGTRVLVFLVGCCGAVWLATIIQIRFKSSPAAGGVAIACLLLLLVAFGVLRPTDLLDQAAKLKGK